MKYSISLFCSFLIIVSCTSSKTSISYAQKDLKKISWIEGNWKGMDGANPFYEIYQFKNDTTIEITSYDWNGTDSSNSSKSLLSWKSDQYYLGDSMNYKVTEITDSSIAMNPNYKANNSILWKTKSPNAWIAILKNKKGEKIYNMERINHFKAKL
jgi:hypothetical protein